MGQTVVLPAMDFTRPGFVDPMKIVEPLQKYRVKQLFGSPALLDRVGRFGERHGVALPDLARVMSAGAPVPPRVMARFSKMLEPGTPIHTPYGATEALPVALTDSRAVLGETAALTARGKGTCVGKPVRGLEVAIIRVDDAPIKTWDDSLRVRPGETGEICVKGPQVTGEYFRRVEDMAKAKIGDGKGFWHRMGDLGYFDGGGRLWFCGRKAHRVGALYTDPVEGIFNDLNGVRRTALVSVRGKPVLCIEAENGVDKAGLKRQILECAGSTELTKWVDGDNVLFHDAFPVDIRHNAKIFREKLSVWAEGRIA
jgi:acyl-coenzyme A synthetase/AMP-(fatty) acid ligase